MPSPLLIALGAGGLAYLVGQSKRADTTTGAVQNERGPVYDASGSDGDVIALADTDNPAKLPPPGNRAPLDRDAVDLADDIPPGKGIGPYGAPIPSGRKNGAPMGAGSGLALYNKRVEAERAAGVQNLPQAPKPPGAVGTVVANPVKPLTPVGQMRNATQNLAKLIPGRPAFGLTSKKTCTTCSSKPTALQAGSLLQRKLAAFGNKTVF